MTGNKLFLPRTLFEGLSGRPPLHASELWPEHKLQLSVTPPPESVVQLSARPEDEGAAESRGNLPKWAAPTISAVVLAALVMVQRKRLM